MKKILRLLAYPYRGAALWTNLAAALCFTFIIESFRFAGIFGLFSIPLAVITLPWFLKYCLVVGERTLEGNREPVRFSLSDISPFEIAPYSLCAVLVLLYIFSQYVFNPTAAMVIVFAIAPAIFSSFIISRSTIIAISPVQWFWIFQRVGAVTYALLVAVLSIALSAVKFIPSGFFLLFKISLILAILVGLFHAIGIILYKNRNKMDIDWIESDEEREASENEAERKQNLDNKLTEWHRLAKQMTSQQLVADVQNWLETRRASTNDYLYIFTQMMNWHSFKTAAKFVPLLVEKLCANRKTARAFACYEQVWDQYGAAALHSDVAIMHMAKAASEAGRTEIATTFFRHLPKQFPESPYLALAEKELAQIEENTVE